MTQDMVERVAQALFRWAKEEWAEDWSEELDPWNDLGDAGRRIWCRKARAAIEAMREPTLEMRRAGIHPSALEIWRDMIDAALK